MDTKYKVILGVVVIAGAFAFGRHSAPEKIKIEEKIVEVIKKEIVRETKKDTKIVEVVKPDGTKETTTEIKEGTKTESNTNTETEVAKTKETTKSSRIVNISALVGMPIDLKTVNPLVYGGSVSTSLIGPVTIGAWGLSNATFGFSLGLNF